MMDSASSSAANSQFSDVGEEVVVENPNGQISRTPPCLKEFNFEDLKTATNNFKPEALVGEGGYGRVYKGWIDENTLTPSVWGTGMVVAIKLWNPKSIQAFEQWQSEVNILGRRYHPNLVELLGYCWEDEMLVLVYEFMRKGSLKNHLFQRNTIKTLSWDIRLKIAIGAARGLLFLHTLEKQIIYRDFKSSVILLDANYNPKISDFGLAKLGPSGDKTHVTTRMMGTYGYAAPEYIQTGHLSAKSDVYSFGVVLLELLTGFKAVDTSRRKDYLVEWLKPIFSQNWRLQTIMNVRMEGQHSSKATSQAAQLILKCLSINPKDRPSMKEVMEVLVQIQAMTFMKKVPEELEQIKVMEEKSKKSKFSSPRCSVAPPRHRQPRRFLTSLKASCQYNYSAKLSNFSLARLGPSSEEVPVSTIIVDTIGYIAPECITNGNKLKTIMDAQMEGQYPSEAQAAQLSLRCLELDPRSRPSMKEVMEVLKEIEALASNLHEEVK
ncbi:hypothetical protein LWI29_016354 [Acer saccharum]|uniref:non-specific serine/threonine protein kinase n=1 Tax=Acer saccharum TaxID=4024 RepID=A0AA39W6F3_ACESA|nr:hypothetical protein LWI29_016354 [Acer saccharum]